MPKIHKLPDELISKIAAGEVIERPAYAVKELVENALDARATSIKIQIQKAGLSYILVSDNGVGMGKDDALISLRPHTTSKISTDDDLFNIKSLGFRGEALSSIAAISTLTIQSRRKKDLYGTEIVISSSKIKSNKSIGMAPGTIIKVENLFKNVPARKKFLKTLQTEYRHILDIAINFALAYPNIDFELINNGSSVFKFTRKDNLRTRIKSLFGDMISSNLISLKKQEDYLKINGFISRPQIYHYNSSKVFIFLNGRPVTDNLIANAIKEAYGNLLESNTYPFAILFIKIPYEIVDVNVHPRKELVKFEDPVAIHSSIIEYVKGVLEKNNLTFYNLSWKDKSTNSPTARLLKEIVSSSEIGSLGKAMPNSEIIQIHNLYLLTETENGLMFIDQHAAHEAILYRMFKDEYLKEKSKSENKALEESIIIQLSLSDAELLNENLHILEKIGFEIEDFGGGAIKINKIPNIIDKTNIKNSITEFIDDLREEKAPREISRRANKMLAYLACRSAIKSGEFLDESERKQLLENLSQQDLIYTCPHGRPAKLEFSLKALDKLFKRK